MLCLMFDDLCAVLRDELPELIAVYMFGSQARGEATSDSDIDLAILCRAPLEPVMRWNLQEELARLAGRDIDLIDLQSASTVMRVSVLRDARVLWEGDAAARALFEALCLSAYTKFNLERAGILQDVAARGRVYG